MPALSNITVKKYDGTTDAVYTAVSGASSDGVPAEYRNQTGFTVPATRPVCKITTRNNGKGTARRVGIGFKWPLSYTDAQGRLVVNGSVNGEFSMILPQDVDPAIVREAHQQFVKLLSSTAVRDTMDSGYAPR